METLSKSGLVERRLIEEGGVAPPEPQPKGGRPFYTVHLGRLVEIGAGVMADGIFEVV